MDPSTADVPNMADLIAIIQKQDHEFQATAEIKDMFFMVPLGETDGDCFVYL